LDRAASGTRFPSVIWLIVAVALALRIGFALFAPRALFSDEVEYDRLAWTLATTGAYSDEGHPTAYRPVGYPAFAAGIYRVAGHDPMAIRLAQAGVDACSVLLLYLLAAPRRRVGLWAAGIWALYPSAVTYTRLLMPETVFTAVLLGAAVLARRGGLWSDAGADARAWGPALGLGMLLGCLALLKPAAILLAAALPLAAILMRERLPAARVGLIALGWLLVAGPWMVRNQVVLGAPTLATNTGANLLIGNNPNATGGYTADVPEGMVSRAGAEGPASSAAIGAAARYIREHPARFVLMGVAKVARVFGTEGEMIVVSFHENPGNRTTRLREKYRALPAWLHLLVSGPYALLMLLGSLGFLIYPRDEVRATFLAVLGCWLATHFVFFGGSRFHFPLMPFFALFTAGVLADPAGAVRALAPRRIAATAVIWLGLLSIWAAEIATIST